MPLFPVNNIAFQMPAKFSGASYMMGQIIQLASNVIRVKIIVGQLKIIKQVHRTAFQQRV